MFWHKRKTKELEQRIASLENLKEELTNYIGVELLRRELMQECVKFIKDIFGEIAEYYNTKKTVNDN